MHAHRSGPGSRPSRRRLSGHTARTAMWAAIVLSLALFGLLIARGWQDGTAATAAAAVLLVACIATCLWAGAQGRTADREVNRAITRLAATRKEHEERSP